MSSTKRAVDPELKIWERVFVPNPQHVTLDQARYLLGVHFSQSDHDRINELSAKARGGRLLPEEEAELEIYIHIGHLLSILKAKVRRKVKQAAGHL